MLIIFSLLLFNQCSKEKTFDCVKSTGDIQKENRYFENFSALYIEDNINVILVQSMPGKIVVEAGDNLLPKIKCVQHGDTLKIQNKNTCNWVRSYKKPMNVYAGVDQIKLIYQVGYGKISTEALLVTDTMRISTISFGEVDLNLQTNFIGFMSDDHATLKISGSAHLSAGSCFRNASVDTGGLKVPWIYLTSKSLVDATIYADSLAQIDIFGDGNVICKGSPLYTQYRHLAGKGSMSYQ